MKLMKIKLAVLFLTVGLVSACAGQAAETAAPVSQPTDPAATVTDVPTLAPAAATDTAAPATEAPAATEPAAAVSTVSFTTDILPIIQSRCINCHGGDRVEEGLSMNTHAELMAGSEHGAVVIPGDAANSHLVEMVQSGEMPKRGPKLTPPQVQLIIDWINEGALNN